jgi:hypothetical protein
MICRSKLSVIGSRLIHENDRVGLHVVIDYVVSPDPKFSGTETLRIRDAQCLVQVFDQ